ncbi:serine protease, partial [Streptomyces sp. SID7499]|nr:serine protease [Streptomyces sp. SID7499]
AVAVALPDRDAELTRAVAAARRAGAVVVASATPDPSRTGTDEAPSRVYWPAGEPGVLSVADMLPAGTRPDGSPPTTGVDLAAPGAGVVS